VPRLAGFFVRKTFQFFAQRQRLRLVFSVFGIGMLAIPKCRVA
jgi:hypothetical protein